MVARRARVAACAALALAVLAGCGAIAEIARLQNRIEDRGYDVRSVNHNVVSGSDGTVQVEAGTRSGQPPPRGQEEIAGVVWRTYARRFDAVLVDLDGEQRFLQRFELEELFGPREASLDERSFGDDVRSGVRTGAVIGVVVLAVAVAAVVLTIVLVRRSSRRRPPPPPPYLPPPGWGYPPPPPPGPPPGY